MSVTTAPSTEAMAALTERIGAGETYSQLVSVAYSELIIDPLEQVDGLRVDVVSEDETQLAETLNPEDRTSHDIRVWFRKKLDTTQQGEIDALKLIVRQVYQRVNNWDSADGRVKVWQCDLEGKECPIKAILDTHRLFVASIALRVEVEAS